MNRFPVMNPSLSAAYAHCTRSARAHYENFPVASFLMPKAVRPSVAAVYAFARTADDFADEGDMPQSERLRLLDDWRNRLLGCLDSPTDPVFIALGDTIKRSDVPLQFFLDLLDAFRQDVVKTEYETFDEVLDYCTRSANPVGRLVLILNGVRNSEAERLSDLVCTGLQLVNFWQDVSVDIRKPRVYIPKEDMERFGVKREDLGSAPAKPAFCELMAFEVERTRQYFTASMSLPDMLPFRLKLEIRAIWHGGMRILDRIAALGYDTVSSRPSLGKIDAARIMFSSLTALSVS